MTPPFWEARRAARADVDAAIDKAALREKSRCEGCGTTENLGRMDLGKGIRALVCGACESTALGVSGLGFDAEERIGRLSDRLREAATSDEPRELTAEEYIAQLRAPLLYYFGTTDPELLADVWKEQARAADEGKASDEPRAPRRHRIDQWVPAERAIHDAVQAVEVMGADVRLTEAVILLGRARDSVADFVDGKCCVHDTDSDGNCPVHSAPGVFR